MTVLAFDIETVPDTAAGRRLLGLGDLGDAEVAEAMFQHPRQQTGGSDFLQHHLHRVVAISCAMRTRDAFKVWSVGEPGSSEAELLTRFFEGIEKYSPDLVSWNGSGFDLPVMHYRALFNGVEAARYWEMGEGDQSFKWNNYISRFHWRHLDLMDVLSGFQARATAKLDEVAQLCGLPGQLGMDGGQVWPAVRDGRIAAVRDYCETDALNTYLLALRFDRMRGRLDAAVGSAGSASLAVVAPGIAEALIATAVGLGAGDPGGNSVQLLPQHVQKDDNRDGGLLRRPP